MTSHKGSSRQRIAHALRVAQAVQTPHDERPHLAGDLLLSYWENTLGEQERAAVDEHVAACAICRTWFAEVGRLFADPP